MELSGYETDLKDMCDQLLLCCRRYRVVSVGLLGGRHFCATVGAEVMKEMLADKCRNRGGDCSCQGSCQAVESINERLHELEREKAVLDSQITDLERTRRRLKRTLPTPRIGFSFNDRYSVTQ